MGGSAGSSGDRCGRDRPLPLGLALRGSRAPSVAAAQLPRALAALESTRSTKFWFARGIQNFVDPGVRSPAADRSVSGCRGTGGRGSRALRDVREKHGRCATSVGSCAPGWARGAGAGAQPGAPTTVTELRGRQLLRARKPASCGVDNTSPALRQPGRSGQEVAPPGPVGGGVSTSSAARTWWSSAPRWSGLPGW